MFRIAVLLFSIKPIRANPLPSFTHNSNWAKFFSGLPQLPSVLLNKSIHLGTFIKDVHAHVTKSLRIWAQNKLYTFNRNGEIWNDPLLRYRSVDSAYIISFSCTCSTLARKNVSVQLLFFLLFVFFSLLCFILFFSIANKSDKNAIFLFEDVQVRLGDTEKKSIPFASRIFGSLYSHK